MLLKAQSASIASKWAGLASLAAQPGTPVVEA
jgi:hypothetical protein